MPKKRTLFVIISGAEQHKRVGRYYITQQPGRKATTIGSKAVKFTTRKHAGEFAKLSHLALDHYTYVDGEGFTEFDLRG